MRAAALGIADLGALILFGIGLVSPLTPSQGLPSPGQLAVFFGLPVLLLTLVAYQARTLPIRILVALQALAVIGFEVWLLGIQSGLLSEHAAQQGAAAETAQLAPSGGGTFWHRSGARVHGPQGGRAAERLVRQAVTGEFGSREHGYSRSASSASCRFFLAAGSVLRISGSPPPG